jgi:GT2 family glycosyltransferase
VADVSVLIPTYERPESLAMTLSGVVVQSVGDLQVVVASQGSHRAQESPAARAIGRVIEVRGGSVEWHHREPRGIAEHRHFLLGCSEADSVLFLDNDIFMEPFVVERLLCVLEAERCGFVGAFPAGLTFVDDVRPEQQKIDLWGGSVTPEVLEVEGPGWERWYLRRAANLYHLAQRLSLPPGKFLRYKVAWIGSCVLCSKEKLLEVGGFSFWERLPRYHMGEDAVVQNLLMRRYGGCGIVPAGTSRRGRDHYLLALRNGRGGCTGFVARVGPPRSLNSSITSSSTRPGREASGFCVICRTCT